MSESNNDRYYRGQVTDAEISAYLQSNYPSGTDSHKATAPTVDEVGCAIDYLGLAAALLESDGELGHLRAKQFEAADTALGCFIRAISPGDAFYAALDLRKTNVTQYSSWLQMPIPEVA